ncbi:MAG TPA: hypothetical protein GX707_09790 [Epulopiscium sp.]|nr:hypothetical protein [Candidatus Epulonipiscium sp.]
MEEISNEIMGINEKLISLGDKYDHIYQQTLHNETMFWTVVFGVFAVIGLALYFIAKGMVQSGVEKGIKRLLTDNKAKLDKRNPEILGPLTLNNSDKDNVNVRLIKLRDEAVINIESDKKDARLTINHKKVSMSDSVVFTTMLFNGWSGKVSMFADSHENYRLVEIVFEDLSNPFGMDGATVSSLPSGFAPKTKTKFKGYGNENVELLFTVRTDGSIVFNGSSRAVENINAHVVFIVHDYDAN